MARWGIPGISFSLKRALGLTALRQKVSKALGVPTTRSGIERKIGRSILNPESRRIETLLSPLHI